MLIELLSDQLMRNGKKFLMHVTAEHPFQISIRYQGVQTHIWYPCLTQYRRTLTDLLFLVRWRRNAAFFSITFCFVSSSFSSAFVFLFFFSGDSGAFLTGDCRFPWLAVSSWILSISSETDSPDIHKIVLFHWIYWCIK